MISFRPRATRIDPDAERDLLALVGTAAAFREAARIEVRAAVDRAAPSLTDARRVAYYRAMAARDLMIRAGIGADRLRLLIDEDRREDDPEIVRIAPLPRDAVRP